MIKRLLAVLLTVVFSAAVLTGCYPLRIAKNPNAGQPVADASQLPDETEAAETEEPADTELPTEEVIGTEELTEAPTEEVTEPPEETEKLTEAPTESATEAATDKPTEGATNKPTESATQKPTEAAGTANATATPKTTPTPTPKPTPTPTPKPTATPTPKPTPTPTPAPASDFAEFSGQSINGYANFTNATFSGSKLTMVNFWATWCGPCIEELPDIQRLSSAYAGRVKIVTVLYDSQTGGAVDQALSIMSSIGVTLPTYRYSGSLKTAFSAHDNFNALPTTFFVDQNGHIVNIAKGGHNYDQWCALINSLL